ncbi:adenylyltransferase/cytidyltransferase family protein [Mariniflexile litorale]|uniref:Adenylyltransferase/cytidyltransferase family protein n=1 Tax=Mariniflexile litorale TaxID=3045158 RepID=A0AAU7EIH1_9FLAO|nr:adenylyltransferase/cytidyltransferase family protein [Mariniflexile sp. KMM 9835]MDQ8209930.1 adenylyltransferase/cytidyltransferase family protein [Mariniflexile sp. KMM 9835]
MSKPKAVIVSGYFNPLHKGHIEYFNNAKSQADKLFVIVNNDVQRQLKESKEFQLEDERLFIIENLKVVDECFLSIDKDRTVIQTIAKIHDLSSDSYDLMFANGGDQNNDTIPEKNICEELNILLVDGMGDKIQSSSWLLNK